MYGCNKIISGLAILLLMIGCIGFFTVWAFKEINFKMQPRFECKATILSIAYNPDTQKTHSVPIVSGNGKVSMAFHATGSAESYITLWDCGQYGILKSDDERVFRLSYISSTLYLKKYNDDVRIVGIKG